jgi:transposase
VVVAGANENDHQLLPATLAQLVWLRPDSACGLCLDKGYDYPSTVELAERFGYTLHLRRRGEDRPEAIPGWRPRRWVVERTFSWLHRARRLATRWEKKLQNYSAFVFLGCAFIAQR